AHLGEARAARQPPPDRCANLPPPLCPHPSLPRTRGRVTEGAPEGWGGGKSGRDARGPDCRRDRVGGGVDADRETGVAGEAVELAREGGAQTGWQPAEADGEIVGVDRGGDHSAAPSRAGSVAVGARRRAKPLTGATARYCDSRVFTLSLMSFCEKVTVSPPPRDFETSPMRLRSR